MLVFTPRGVYGIRRKTEWNQHKVLDGIKPQKDTPTVMLYAFSNFIHAEREAIPSLWLG